MLKTCCDCEVATLIINAAADKQLNTPLGISALPSLLESISVAGGVKLYPAKRLTERGTFPNIGWRSIFFSHIACLREALRQGEANVVLLEDRPATSDMRIQRRRKQI